MDNGFWISFAFTCGIAVGRYLPKLIEWALDRMLGSEDAE